MTKHIRPSTMSLDEIYYALNSELLAKRLLIRQAVINRSKKSFKFFFNNIWSESIQKIEGEKFLEGDHIDKWCDLFQYKSFLSLVAPRKHLKSTIARAYIGWLIFNIDSYDAMITEFWYFSYTSTLAGEHTEKIQKYIEVNSYFTDFKKVSDAKTILEYKKGDKVVKCQAEGILSATRGRHPHGVICDDLLRDPSSRLNITQIQKISKLFFEEIVSIPKEGGFLKLIGTPQDERDLFYEVEKKKRFNCYRFKAVTNWKDKQVLWAAKYSFTRLMEIRDDEIGTNAFEKEYMVAPVRAVERYLNREKLEDCTNNELKNWNLVDTEEFKDICFAGFDIGKKQHPSHLAVFKREPSEKHDYKLIQVMSKWMDGWDYIDQVDFLNMAVEKFNIEKLCFDNTRSELESFMEKNELDSACEGIFLSAKQKFKMAPQLEKKINNGSIEFLYDERQTNQLLVVDNDLKAMVTSEGHGDSFISICLAVDAANEEDMNIRFV